MYALDMSIVAGSGFGQPRARLRFAFARFGSLLVSAGVFVVAACLHANEPPTVACFDGAQDWIGPAPTGARALYRLATKDAPMSTEEWGLRGVGSFAYPYGPLPPFPELGMLADGYREIRIWVAEPNYRFLAACLRIRGTPGFMMASYWAKRPSLAGEQEWRQEDTNIAWSRFFGDFERDFAKIVAFEPRSREPVLSSSGRPMLVKYEYEHPTVMIERFDAGRHAFYTLPRDQWAQLSPEAQLFVRFVSTPAFRPSCDRETPVQ